MADGANDPPEGFDYIKAMESIVNFVDNELGKDGTSRRRPDDGEWRVQRAKTIRKLNEFREKLDKVCVGANYGKAVGNGAEIGGSATAMVGAIMALSGINASQAVLNIGNLVYHSGSLIDGVSNVIESLVSANYLGEIEAVLERDKKLSLPLAEWLDFSRELDANIEAIFGVSLASKKFHTVMKVFHEWSKFYSSARGFSATISLMKQGRYSVYIGNDVKLEKLQKFFQHLSASPQLADKIRVTLSILSSSTAALQVVSDGVQVSRSIMGTSSSAVSTLRGGLHLQIPTARAVSAFCTFQAISMAISVISLINAASIIRNGTSQYSDALKQLTRSLAWELRRMEDL